MALCQSRSDAEDLCQETFIAAFRGLKGFRGGSSFKTWLTSILMRRAATMYRKQRYARQTISLHRDNGGNGHSGGDRDLFAEQLSVPSATTTVDQRLDLLEVIRSLAPDFHQVLVLREIDGMSYQEIADTLGIPRGTVESRLFRARAELRKRLSGY